MANWSHRVSAERQRTKEEARSARHLSLKNRSQQGPWARGAAKHLLGAAAVPGGYNALVRSWRWRRSSAARGERRHDLRLGGTESSSSSARLSAAI